MPLNTTFDQKNSKGKTYLAFWLRKATWCVVWVCLRCPEFWLLICFGKNGSYHQLAEFLPVKWVWHINRLLNVKKPSDAVSCRCCIFAPACVAVALNRLQIACLLSYIPVELTHKWQREKSWFIFHISYIVFFLWSGNTKPTTNLSWL